MARRTVGMGIGIALLAIACHSATGPQGPLAGHWYGFNTGYGLDLLLTDGGGSVRGSGTLGGNDVNNIAIAVSISGSEGNSAFTLTLKAQQYQPATYSGTMDDDTTLSGTISGSGFTSAALTVFRQK